MTNPFAIESVSFMAGATGMLAVICFLLAAAEAGKKGKKNF